MRETMAIAKRELLGYFATPLAYVFIVIFLFTMGVFTFYIGNFYQNERAELTAFFGFHPWLYLFLIPAISMRLWAEERKAGTLELLLTLPIPLYAAVLGKFLAAWAFAGLALILTFPIWITVNYLGDPDNGVIFASYIGSFLMAGAFLAIGSCVSAMTSSQVIAFVVSVVVCFLFTVAGTPIVIDVVSTIFPLAIVNAISSFSFLTHFASITAGVIDLRDLIYFLSLIALFLFATAVLIDLRKAG
ncbi:MAG: ABC transporter permease [Alphaproteobacteria bacterium]|nr:ABC transporter permease [Alphaproteobacteria bacterium]